MAKSINGATRIKDISVSFLSVVGKGANGKKVIWKSGAQATEGAEELSVALRDVRKSDEKQMVFGVVYAPEQVDSQGEFALASDIEAAAYGFMKSKNVLSVDANHDFDPKAAYVAESWIIKGTDSLFDKEPEGTWCVGIKVEDAELWERVKKGELEGISMAGSAVKIKKDEKDGSGIMSKLEQLLSGLLKKEADQTGGEVKKDDGTEAKEGTTLSDKDAEAIAKAMQEIVEENQKLTERIEALEKSSSGKQSSAVDGGGNDSGVDYSDIV